MKKNIYHFQMFFNKELIFSDANNYLFAADATLRAIRMKSVNAKFVRSVASIKLNST